MVSSTRSTKPAAVPSIEQDSVAIARTSAKTDPKPAHFTVSTLGGTRRYSYESLFVEGHELWLKRDFAKAFKIFDLLCSVTDRGPRAAIVKAHCAVMEQKFSDCSAILWQALPKASYGKAAANLHDIFVFWKFKFYNEVRKELELFVADFSDLPTPALLLGDFFSLAGQPDKAVKYLQLALDRDREGGSVARIAIARKDMLSSACIKQAKR